ncbi:MAG: hypothetical protein HQK55_16405 [Deltaproteobacteria bacterium]|nr:hypothetical protein [Deltaproteobacteria bacterium]
MDNLPGAPGDFDLIVMAQTIWCVLPNLRQLLSNYKTLLAPSGSLLISQHFLKPGQQKYGMEILSSAEDLIRLLRSSGFKIDATLETNRLTNHHLAIMATPLT